MRLVKRIVTLAVLACVCTVSLSGCSYKDKPVIFQFGENDTTIFIINEMECTYSEAMIYLMNAKNIYGTVDGINLWSDEFNTEVIQGSLKDAVMSHLIKVFVLNQYAFEQGITLSENDLSKISEAAKEYYDSLTDEERAYARIKDVSQIETMYQHYALAHKVYSGAMSTVDEEVSEDEARIMEALVLFVTTEDEAKEMQGMIDYGYTFERLAATYTTLDSFRFTFGRGQYPQNVDDVVFNLDTDEVSGALEADNGYYFFQCKKKYLEDESEANKAVIIQKRREKVFEDIMATQEGKYTSRLFEDNWEKLSLDTEVSITTATFFKTLSNYL
ncbi:MAG: hypothetical protein HUJ71_09060 [Pseudobutyrivibrio sp.]|nr:hypothetical protein [Pseudobutyrivibrio sp.]